MNNFKECRICLLDNNQEDLISPCSCKGTSKYVHRECLAKWINVTSNTDARLKCLSCNSEYNFEEPRDSYVYKKISNLNNFFLNGYFCISKIILELFYSVIVSYFIYHTFKNLFAKPENFLTCYCYAQLLNPILIEIYILYLTICTNRCSFYLKSLIYNLCSPHLIYLMLVGFSFYFDKMVGIAVSSIYLNLSLFLQIKFLKDKESTIDSSVIDLNDIENQTVTTPLLN